MENAGRKNDESGVASQMHRKQKIICHVNKYATTRESAHKEHGRTMRSGIEYHRPCYATCPREWIGFGNKCFYFSEDMRNWTSSQTSCMALEAHLAKFESLEELNFMKRYKGPSDHWIGLHRKSSHHLWRWTDNTEYNSSVLTRGEGECAYLSDRGISSARDYTPKKWICSKSNSYT
ncbi:C-type lectin domain family 2 member E-like [Microtus pennsylvanicus]|uniref:C-type lectin domain family 2 member E-like n=1 Tax=Microtus pennsylvanicus TaxID=10058 RepID=UPI003F6C4737